MIGAVFWIAIGISLSAAFPSLPVWVRGVAGKARDAVLGSSRPARQPDIQPDMLHAATGHKVPANPDNGQYMDHYPTGHFSPPSPNKPIDPGASDFGRKAQNVTKTVTPVIDFGRAAANVTGFAVGLLSWCARNPIVAIGLVTLALWLVMGAPFGFGKSKGELRLERELAEATAVIRQHEAHLAELSRDLAVNTERDRSRRATVIAQAEQELGNAAAQVDPDALYDVYAQQYLCLLDAAACASSPNPAPRGPPSVRGADASPV